MFAIPLKYNDLINSDSKIYLKYDNREILIPPRYEITNYEGIFRTESLCKVDDEFNGFKYNVYDGNEQLPDCTNNTFPCKNIVNIINIDSTLYNINEISKRKSTDRRESKDFTKNIVLPSINKFNHNIIDVSNQYINKEVIRLFKKIDCEKKQDYCNKIAEQYENNTEIIQMYSFIACTLVQIARKIIPNYTYNIEDDPDYSKILTKIKDLTFGKRRSKIRNNKKVKSKSRKKRRSHAKKPRTLYSPRPPTI
jgi:hypothetical protein